MLFGLTYQLYFITKNSTQEEKYIDVNLYFDIPENVNSKIYTLWGGKEKEKYTHFITDHWKEIFTHLKEHFEPIGKLQYIYKGHLIQDKSLPSFTFKFGEESIKEKEMNVPEWFKNRPKGLTPEQEKLFRQEEHRKVVFIQ